MRFGCGVIIPYCMFMLKSTLFSLTLSTANTLVDRVNAYNGPDLDPTV